MIRLLMVEDTLLLRETMIKLLKWQSGIVVVEALERGDGVVEAVLAHRPDIVLLDVHLPGMTGLAVAKELQRTAPETKVLILTAFEKPGYAELAWKHGVHGFLAKTTTHPDKVIEAIHLVHRGELVYDPDLLRQMRINGQNPLTKSERRILRHVQRGLTARQIANMLSLAEGTVRNHTTRAINKLHAQNGIDAVRKADELGYLDDDDYDHDSDCA